MDPLCLIFRVFLDQQLLVGSKESPLTKVPTITVINKDIKEMGFLFIEALFIIDSQSPSSKRVENAQCLRMEMMGVGMKIFLSMSFLLKHLVGEGTVIIL